MGEGQVSFDNIEKAVQSDPRIHTFVGSSLNGLPFYMVGSNAPITPNEIRQAIEAEKARVVWVHPIGERDSFSYILRFQLGRGKTGYIRVEPDMNLLH